jgi:Flp pilus assembly pilin Flp
MVFRFDFETPRREKQFAQVRLRKRFGILRLCRITKSVVSYTNFVGHAAMIRRPRAFTLAHTSTGNSLAPKRLAAIARAISAMWYGGCVCLRRSRRVPRRTQGRQHMLLNWTKRVLNSLRNEDGQDLLEYALLVALIAIVAVAGVTAAGGEVNAIFKQIVDKLPG